MITVIKANKDDDSNNTNWIHHFDDADYVYNANKTRYSAITHTSKFPSLDTQKTQFGRAGYRNARNIAKIH